jgi:hypothetical protein
MMNERTVVIFIFRIYIHILFLLLPIIGKQNVNWEQFVDKLLVSFERKYRPDSPNQGLELPIVFFTFSYYLIEFVTLCEFIHNQ